MILMTLWKIIVLFKYEWIAIITDNRNYGADARERNCEMLIAFIMLEVFDIWMVYVGQETEKIQVISNCSIYER